MPLYLDMIPLNETLDEFVDRIGILPEHMEVHHYLETGRRTLWQEFDERVRQSAALNTHLANARRHKMYDPYHGVLQSVPPAPAQPPFRIATPPRKPELAQLVQRHPSWRPRRSETWLVYKHRVVTAAANCTAPFPGQSRGDLAVVRKSCGRIVQLVYV